MLYIASGTATFRNAVTGIVSANAKPFSLVFDAQTIDVEVKNVATANALAGAQVTFQCESVTQSCPPAATVGSSAAGLARFYAPSGKYRVTVKQSGYQDMVLKVTVAQANDRSATINPNNIQTVKVALSSTASPETGALTGLISTPSGASAVGATVTVTGGGFSRSATTDSQGRYAVSGVRVATDGRQAIYDHQVQVVALGYQIAAGAIPVLGKKVQTFNARLVALTCSGSQVPGYGACVSPAQTAWCGQTVRFDNNQLPTGWTPHLVRGGPGVINNRLEARPTDSGATVESPTAAMPAGVSSVVVEFDNTQTLSFYGQFNIIEFKTTLGKYWTFGDVPATLRIGDGNREFSTYLNSQPFWNQLASTAELRKVQTVALGLGNFKTRLTLRNGMSEWALVDNATGTVTNVSQTPDVSFVLSDLVGFNASVYTTTGGTATMDNISIQCLR